MSCTRSRAALGWLALLASLLAATACGGPTEAKTPCTSRDDCTGGAACVAGHCQPCPACGAGEVCLEGACRPAACGDRPCRADEACVAGTCRAADCAEVTCPAGQSCARGSCYPVECGASTCSQGEVCWESACTAPSCVNVTCPSDQTCAAGACLPTRCAGVVCAVEDVCQDGRCVSARCVGVVCQDGTRCADGRCLPTACNGVECASDEVCAEARCVAAACVGVVCPEGSLCRAGACAEGTPLTILSANPLHSRDDSATFSGACAEGLPIVLTGTEGATIACSAQAWSYATAAQTSDGARDYVFAQQGSAPVTGTWIRDTAGPALQSTAVNGGAAFAITPFLRVAATASDASGPISLRVAEAGAGGDCQGQYADDRWQADPLAAQVVVVSPVEGPKKVCAWAKDALGNVSVIAPSEGTPGVDTATLEYRAGSLPEVTSLAVSNGTAGANFGTTTYAAGDTVHVAWTAVDAEGLAEDPVSIYVTTDGSTWTPVAERTGSLGGHPTSASGSYDSFTAPSAGFFRLQVVAWDEAGNSSLALRSDAQNTPNWSFYAGSTDVGLGGTSRAAALTDDDNTLQAFDVDPLSGALFTVTATHLLRLDPVTGVVTPVMRKALTTNLPDDGPLPADPTFAEPPRFRFDTDGLLYLAPHNDHTTSAVLYQLDLARGWCRRYLGGGTANDGSATPATVDYFAGPFAFDEDHALYFESSCTPGSWTGSTSTVRLLKATQNADRTAGAISLVAGNCVREAPPDSGAPAATSPFNGSYYPCLGTLEVWNRGEAIYYGTNSMPVHKILRGGSYRSNAPQGLSLARDPATGKLYVAQGALYEIAEPNLAGDDGDASTVYVSNAGTSATCLEDGTDAAQACVRAHFDVRAVPGGPPLFVDGRTIAEYRPYRIRFKDAGGAVRTALGSLPFAPGALRRAVRASFSGIHYKQPTDPNQAQFPAGLYFLDGSAPLLGYLDPATERVSVRWGNQQLSTETYPSGTPVSPDLPLGGVYPYDARALAFDASGLPWLRYNNLIASVDAAGLVVQRQGGGAHWELAQDGDSPAGFDSYISGTLNNLTLRGEGVLFLGGSPSTTSVLSVQLHDYAADRVTWVMGAAANTFSEDTYPTTGTVAAQSLSADCWTAGSCHTVYRADEDTLYYGEIRGTQTYVRSITTPANPATSTLRTLFAVPAPQRVENFIFSLDHQAVLYLTAAGALRCHALGATGAAWCDDTALGPPAGFSPLFGGPNSLTWRDAEHLLISNYAGEIYEFTLPSAL